MIDAAELKSIAAWAQGLSDAEIERARRGVSIKTFGRGAHLCHRDDKFEHWAGVVDGLMKFGSTDAAGRVVSFGGLPPGMWFGEGSLLKNEARQYDVVALRDTRLALMNKPTFDWLCDASVAFNRYLVRQFNERLGLFIALLEHARTLDATARVARNIAWLINPVIAPRAGDRIEISQEELGLLSGVSRQAANAALRQLAAEGLVTVDHRSVIVRDRTRLARYGGE
ncbi:MAG: Crp/Fnr family transcriptional regulator [Rhodoblastus sp.]|nr:MAG: Crp/Fnr family transcriptional regulator [Rhodoblastus sp.]